MIGVALLLIAGVGAGFALRGGGSNASRVRHAPAGEPAQLPPQPAPTIPPAPAGVLTSPTALAIAPDGTLLVADGDRIVRRATDGTFSVVADIGASSLAVAPDGTIFVAGSGLIAIAPDGTITTVAELPAVSVALAPDGTIYVVDQTGVEAVELDGSMRTVVRDQFIDVEGTRMAFFPSAVTVDLDGNLYVADAGVKLLAEFAPDGAVLETWGPQVYVSPNSGLTTAPDGSIVVAEWGGRIERLADGVFSTVADGYRANGVAVASDGTIYFTDGGNGWREGAGLSAIDATGTITRLEPR